MIGVGYKITPNLHRVAWLMVNHRSSGVISNASVSAKEKRGYAACLATPSLRVWSA